MLYKDYESFKVGKYYKVNPPLWTCKTTVAKVLKKSGGALYLKIFQFEYSFRTWNCVLKPDQLLLKEVSEAEVIARAL
jgi:hypothetical protein